MELHVVQPLVNVSDAFTGYEPGCCQSFSRVSIEPLYLDKSNYSLGLYITADAVP